jgi:hypothetical protein
MDKSEQVRTQLQSINADQRRLVSKRCYGLSPATKDELSEIYKEYQATDEDEIILQFEVYLIEFIFCCYDNESDATAAFAEITGRSIEESLSILE